MAMTQKDRRQLQGLLIVVAVVAMVMFWVYWREPKVLEAQNMRREIDSLQTRVDSARAALREGTVEELRRRVEGYRRSLVVMRQLVPTTNEVTNLIDEVSTRAQLRGVQITDLAPLPLEFAVPFEVHRYRFTVQGGYDQIGEFLTDVASLSRIMVPYELSLSPATTIVGEEVDRDVTVLQATFLLRTFVKGEGEVIGGGMSGGAP